MVPETLPQAAGVFITGVHVNGGGDDARSALRLFLSDLDALVRRDSLFVVPGVGVLVPDHHQHHDEPSSTTTAPQHGVDRGAGAVLLDCVFLHGVHCTDRLVWPASTRGGVDDDDPWQGRPLLHRTAVDTAILRHAVLRLAGSRGGCPAQLVDDHPLVHDELRALLLRRRRGSGGARAAAALRWERAALGEEEEEDDDVKRPASTGQPRRRHPGTASREDKKRKA